MARQGVDGHIIWRYRLERIDRSAVIEPELVGPATRQMIQAQRIVRESSLAQSIKIIHDFRCQICGERLESPNGPYAEAAHIKPLGRPDDGPDISGNLLCVCPKHHKLLDNGGIVVNQDLAFVHIVSGQIIGPLTQNPKHMVGVDFLNWHRERWTQAL